MQDMQDNLLARARAFMDEHTRSVDTWDDFTAFFTPARQDKPKIHGVFALAHWCGEDACEQRANDELAVTIRCIPFDREDSDPGACIACGAPSPGRVVFAKSY